MSTHVAAQPPKRVQKLKGKPWKARFITWVAAR